MEKKKKLKPIDTTKDDLVSILHINDTEMHLTKRILLEFFMNESNTLKSDLYELLIKEKIFIDSYESRKWFCFMYQFYKFKSSVVQLNEIIKEKCKQN